jgi:NAD(P)-dependent dehydrogenase (short-subunit alcohol dehydrogenase family)
VDALLRDGLLDGLPVHVSGDGDLAAAARTTCAGLGARLVDNGAAVLVHDASGTAPGVAGVHEALDGTWDAIRPVATASMIDGGGGKVILLAPRPGDAHRAAARAGLENLARTLGIEWARFAIRTVTVLPGVQTTDDEVAQLVAYVASPAGDYFSGCAITLGAVARRGG